MARALDFQSSWFSFLFFFFLLSFYFLTSFRFHPSCVVAMALAGDWKSSFHLPNFRFLIPSYCLSIPFRESCSSVIVRFAFQVVSSFPSLIPIAPPLLISRLFIYLFLSCFCFCFFIFIFVLAVRVPVQIPSRVLTYLFFSFFFFFLFFPTCVANLRPTCFVFRSYPERVTQNSSRVSYLIDFDLICIAQRTYPTPSTVRLILFSLCLLAMTFFDLI